MDTNCDGQVDWNEFSAFLYQSGNQWISPSFFNDLDRNHDGALDFMEVLTFYYIIKTRSFWCSVCGICLTGLYFTCVECFDNVNSNTYDLCPGCYESKPERQRYNRQSDHHHAYFMDNHMLLRSKTGGYGSSNLATLHNFSNIDKVHDMQAIDSPGGGPGRNRIDCLDFDLMIFIIVVVNLPVMSNVLNCASHWSCVLC
ncbi:hypothetical protein ACLB2K_023353 [Fragaria x ananassa]